MTLKIQLLLAALVAAFLFGGGWAVKGWKTDSALKTKETQIAQLKQQRAEQLRDLADKTREVAELVGKNTVLNQAAIAAVDTQITEKKHADEKELDRLRRCVAANTCGVRIVTQRAVCSPSASDSQRGNDAAPGSVGDAAVQLDAETGLAVLDLRSSVKDDDRKLEYLQAYARQCAGIAAQNEQLNMHPR